MTLDKVEIDLKSAFGCGMVYVALSRASSLDGMRLLSFDKHKIKASPKAIEFLNSITSSNSSAKTDDDDGSSTKSLKRKHEETQID